VATLREDRQIEDGVVEETSEQLQKRIDKLQTKLREKQKAKSVAQQQLEKARKEIERGGLDEEERLRLWRSRIAAVKQRVAEAEQENRRLEGQFSSNQIKEDEEFSDSSGDDW
jgi:predicted RNase H-like nuclease (RuvC/YqgF family)